MNQLANMYQGGMNGRIPPQNPIRQPITQPGFPTQPPVSEPNMPYKPVGFNNPQNGYNQSQNGGGQPQFGQNFGDNWQQKLDSFATNHTGLSGFMGGNNFGQNFWQNHPRMNEWRQEHPNYGQRQPNLGLRRDSGGWIGGDLGWPTNGDQNRGW